MSKRSFAVVSVLFASFCRRVREHSMRVTPISPLSPLRELSPNFGDGLTDQAAAVMG